jgi:hypothetical protein
MGRFVKNYAIHTGGHAVGLPIGSNLIGPDSPIDGQVRINLDNAAGLEYYFNGAWKPVSAVGRVTIVKDDFIGDGAMVGFGPMTNSYTTGQEAGILVFISSVFQEPGVAYVVSGTSIIFTSAPPFGSTIVILHNFNSTLVQ